MQNKNSRCYSDTAECTKKLELVNDVICIQLLSVNFACLAGPCSFPVILNMLSVLTIVATVHNFEHFVKSNVYPLCTLSNIVVERIIKFHKQKIIEN